MPWCSIRAKVNMGMDINQPLTSKMEDETRQLQETKLCSGRIIGNKYVSDEFVQRLALCFTVKLHSFLPRLCFMTQYAKIIFGVMLRRYLQFARILFAVLNEGFSFALRL